MKGIYTINTDTTDYVTIQCNLASKPLNFLVDSQADISIMKISSLNQNFSYDTCEIIRIKGITNSAISTFGTVFIKLLIDNVSIEHKFHLVPDSIAIPTDGIIGKEFIKAHRCNLDYGTETFVIRLPFTELHIPMTFESNGGSSIIPPRSEVFRLFTIKSIEFPCLINTRELKPGVIIPNTIAYSNKGWIRVLNTAPRCKQILTNNIKGIPLTNYDIKITKNPNPDLTKNNSRTVDLMKILKNQIQKHAPPELLKLCLEYSHIFAMPGDEGSTNNFYKQKLILKDDIPVYVKNYRLPQTQKCEIDNQVNNLLSKNLIEMSTSSYNSPLILVPKKSPSGVKKWRMCVDYRLLNKKLIPDKFPLPRIEDIFDRLGKTKFFSVMDLQSGFHQIPLDENSRAATAFSTENGFYQWTVLPFGLCIAPSSFSRMMSIAFSGLSPDHAFIYMDDIIVIGDTESTHLKNLKAVFENCDKFNLKINPEKCDFFKSEVTFLGHTCTANGILPNKNKIDAIERYPRPHDKESTKRFVAFANYYNRFIPNFAKLSQPLNKITRKRYTFEWTNDCEESFQKLKKLLISPQILQYPDFSKPFILTVDASNYACGAVLSQITNGHDLPVCFISKTFTKGEINKPIIEKELLAIHYSIKKLRPYLYGRSFTVRSDHKPLIYLYNLKNPSSKLTNLRLDLEEYDFVVEHIRGKDNVAADALSRIALSDLKDLVNVDPSNVLAVTRSMSKKLENSSKTQNDDQVDSNIKNVIEKSQIIEELGTFFDKNIPRIKTEIYTSQRNYQSIERIELYFYKGHNIVARIDIKKPANEILTLKTIISQLQRAAEKFKIGEAQWPLSDKIFKMCKYEEFKMACQAELKNLKIIISRNPIKIVDEKQKMQLLEQFHKDPLYGGHAGQKRLYAKLRAHYYWKAMSKDVAKYVKNCKICQLNKPKAKNIEEMTLTKTPQRPFDVVIIDTMGPLTTSLNGNKYALTMICDLTKYLITAPLKTKTANEVAKAIFDNFILKHGPMKQIRTDMGTEYCNSVLKELCELMKVDHKTSTAYHHQSVGTIERNHRTFNEYLKSYLSDELDKWDVYLSYFTFCYNITENSSNNNKYSPFELVYGRKVNLPNELLNGQIDPLYNMDNYVQCLKQSLQRAHVKATNIIDKIKIRNKNYHDQKAKPLRVNVKDKVLVEIEPYNKHGPKYKGPFEILDLDEPNVIVKTDKGNIKIHKDRIRPI